MQGEFLMANVDDINIGELESSLDRARQQTALLKAIRGETLKRWPNSCARKAIMLRWQRRASSSARTLFCGVDTKEPAGLAGPKRMI